MSQQLGPAFLSSLAFLSLSPFAQAQLDATVLVKEGDLLPNGWTVAAIRDNDLDNAGGWASWVNTTNPGDFDDVLLQNGSIVMAEGSPYLGEVVRFTGSVALDDQGKMAVLYAVVNPNGSSDALSRLAIEGNIVLSEDDVLTIPGLPAAGSVNQILSMDWALPYLTTTLELIIPGSGLTRVHVTHEVDQSSLALINPVLHGQVGAMPPGVPGALEVIFSPAVDTSGKVTSAFRSDDASSDGYGIFLNNFAYRVDGTPGLFVGSTWNSGGISADVAIRDGKYASAGQIERNDGSLLGLVTGPAGRVAQEEGLVNGDPAYRIDDFLYTDVDVLGDSRVLYAVPIVGGAPVMVLEDEIILEAMVSEADGTLITDIPYNFRDVLHVSANARFTTCRVTLEGGDDALVRSERSPGTVSNCATVPNSTGVTGQVSSVGSAVVDLNELEIVAFDLPLSSFGYLITSKTPGFVTNPGGSTGNLCLGGNIGRYVGQIASSGPLGRIRTQIDLESMPQPAGAIPVVPGETWGFQLWHRDMDGAGMPTSNFTRMMFISFL